jgi:hypothetical protein
MAALACAMAHAGRAQDLPVPVREDCARWEVCRDLALDAATREEYERFHDLAWRTVQTGPPRSTDLMFLLARAQSLSGRPHDALVMLRRIAEQGSAPVAALADDDFRRVRALSDWPVVEALINAVAERASPAPAPAAPVAAGRTSAVTPEHTSAAPAATATPPPIERGPHPARSGRHPQVDEALRFESAGWVPSGLAFDAVSGRFLFGTTNGRKVVVVGEQSDRVVDLVRAESAAFYDVLALEIDPRRGDLWVATSEIGDSDGHEETSGRAAIHKLQLVSGRPLATLPVPTDGAPIRLSDLAVTTAGVVMALDREGSRLWRLPPGGRQLEALTTLAVRAPNSLAIETSGRYAYVAHEEGLARVDLATRELAPVRATKNVVMSGIERVRWHRGSLVAVQRTSAGARHLIRFRLTPSGDRIAGVDVLDPSLPRDATPPAVALSGSDFYYTMADRNPDDVVGPAKRGDPVTMIVRRARIR